MTLKLIKIISSNPKRVFLIDSIGAALSAIFIFLIVSFFDSKFGLAKNVLYLLCAIACILSIYSMTCYFIYGRKWRKYLWIVLIANILYCMLTFLCLLISYKNVTFIGLIYFILEIISISFLVFIELKTVNNWSNYNKPNPLTSV